MALTVVSDRDSVGDPAAMKGRRSEQLTGGSGTSQEQVRWVLPRESDATVNLDDALGRLHERIGAASFGDTRGGFRIRLPAVGQPCRVHCRGFSRFGRNQNPGAAMLDRLERADRT